MRRQTFLGNQSGQLTFDFLIAITLALGLFILFFAITYTFTTVEISQYVAFSAARAQAGANSTVAAQQDAANTKLTYLTTGHPIFKSQYSTGWFTFDAKKAKFSLGAAAGSTSPLDALGNGSNAQYEQVFTGISVPFLAPVWSFHVPFISSGPAQPDGEGGFVTNINAVLIREPSVQECQQWWDPSSRGPQIGGLKSGAFPGFDMKNADAQEDNGC